MPFVEKSDPSMAKIKEEYERRKSECGWTLHILGLAMGFPRKHARKSAYQRLNIKVPRMDTLRRFSRAFDIALEELVKIE